MTCMYFNVFIEIIELNIPIYELLGGLKLHQFSLKTPDCPRSLTFRLLIFFLQYSPYFPKQDVQLQMGG